MPIYQLQCPDCGHRFSGTVFEGTRPPQVWVCPRCDGDNARMLEGYPPTAHPMEASHGGGCPCCGGGGGRTKLSSAEES